ncbi:amphi-Trp domain-containing protein [Halosolutus gelatinilyticus]|uniref:amphi-Trp domain-containing protein n=1 Tax=Halosolutus gelatinilyticus TaxID=2931975 RepID=UPI001FF14F1A|nr:amphi-Trp domain-containing protein [Halosolutus gelatinilyticus]
MPEEVLFKFEDSMDAAAIADYLRTVADRLEAGDELTLEAGGESVTMSPPARPTFEVKAERETPSGGGPGELSVEFELEWDEGADGGESRSGGLSID